MSEAAAAAGLSPVSAWALVQLDPDHPISQKELAARIHCQPSTVVDPTDRLEAGRLVIRQPNRSDRRVNVLIVTAKGNQVRQKLIERLFEPPEDFRRLPAREQTRFRNVMLATVTGTRPGAPPHPPDTKLRPELTSGGSPAVARVSRKIKSSQDLAEA
ncbi:MAG TPA: MarR family winged helix-turn-helix transcriptional regulator [Candidatus Dormibacteraeota bacterium]|nr:MarR family winged helix-turn-helix transcriptional regulator [Candidatus Dormibacteraeota bacterium]